MDQRRLFWLLVAAFSTVVGLALPLIWGLVATVPIMVVCWWIIYRSEWF